MTNRDDKLIRNSTTAFLIFTCKAGNEDATVLRTGKRGRFE